VGQDPTRHIIGASYADDLTRKLSVDTRTVIDNPWYREHFPPMQLAAPRPRNTDLITTRQGTSYATGMDRSILGRGADLIVIDDHIKATDTLFQRRSAGVSINPLTTPSTRA
jgi:hypothetical protein